MKSAAIICLGLLLMLIQGNLHRVFGLVLSIGPTEGVIARALQVLTATPDLVLPLIIFLGVHELSMVRGALLAFVLGRMVDLLGSEPVWLFTFVSVAIWWLARVFGIRLTAQTPLTRIPMVFAFAIVQSAIVLMLLAIFGADQRRPLELGEVVLPRALITALLAPFVFRIAQRLYQGAGNVQTAEGQAP